MCHSERSEECLITNYALHITHCHGGVFLEFGISTACFYPEDLLMVASNLAKYDIRCTEIFANTFSELTETTAKKITDFFSPKGIVVTSVHPFTSGYEHILLFSDYYQRFKDSIEFYKNYFHFANYVGAKIVVLHGDKRFADSGGISDEEYFERYHELYQTAKTMGIMVGQENVNAFRSQNPSFIRKMREYLGDEVAFVFDIKQAVRSGYSPYEMCEAMGDRIVHLHINDNTPQQDCMLPSYGEMDYRKILTQMRQQHFQGRAVIEVYHRHFRNIEEIVQSYHYLAENFGDL